MYSDGRRSAERALARRLERGISMLEALAAAGFLSVALLGLGANTVGITRSAKTADGVAAANALGVQKLEQLRSMPLGAVQLGSGQYYDSANPMQADGTGGGVYSRSWTVSQKDYPRWGLKTVTVTVSWQDSRPHFTRVAAYVRCSAIPCTS
jgi:Tfp pilus assembly protein PilV